MRDGDDNGVIVCSIENVDPHGRAHGRLDHGGARSRRSPTASTSRCATPRSGAPRDRRRDRRLQRAVRGRSRATGRQVLIEMNPRVSRSSALASKATGFPIAKIAALLAVGYRLDEITNDITGETPASFEPTLDYVVVKIPRFAFEKFPEADPVLTSTMKSVGEVMAIGRTFKEALGKAWRGHREGRVRPGAADGVPGADLLEAVGGPRRGPVARCGARARCGPHGGRGRRGAAASTRGSSTRSTQVVEGAHALRGQAAVDVERRRAPGREADWACPTRGSRSSGARPRRRSAATATRSAYGRSSRPSTRAPASSRRARPTTTRPTRRRPRSRPADAAPGGDPRFRAEPDRAGDRVRLRVRARRVRAGGGRVRVGDGELEPRDGLDRLRHVEPAVLRAAVGRGRAGRLPRRAAGRRDRPARRPDAAAAGAHAGRRGLPGARHLARRDRPGRGPRASSREILAELDIAAPPHGEARTMAEARADRRPHRVSGGRPAVVRARRAGDGDRLRRRRARDVRAHRRRGLARSPGA